MLHESLRGAGPGRPSRPSQVHCGVVSDDLGQPDPADAPKVLYVVGKGRSGSTLLDIILGEIEGHFSTGQLKALWSSGLLKGYDCGCERPVPTCDVWRAILAEAFERTPDPGHVVRLQADLLSWRRAPRMLRAARRGSVAGWPELEEYTGILASLYRGIARATGSRVIVDSSKAPAHPGALGLVPGIVPYVVHLVRDPRAVAYSWRRRKALPGRGSTTEMPRFGPVYSAASWLVRNVTADRNRRLLPSERSMVVRYEDLAARPVETVSAITAMLREDVRLPFVDERTVKLSTNHTVSGNPIRTNVGEIALKPDREWAELIRPWDRRVVTLLTGPMRRRYGY